MEPTRPHSATHHRSELGTWERAWRRPSTPLRGLVTGYTGYRQRLAVAATHRGVPAPSVPLVVSFGPAQRIRDPDGAAVTVDSFVAGLHDRYVLIDAEDYHGVQADLTPLGAYRLLGQPLRELTGSVVPLEALFGRAAGRLADDLVTAPGWPERFGLLDRFLAERATALLAGIAATAGYYDQAHLANELRELVGLSAGQLRAHTLPEDGGVFERMPAASASSKTPPARRS